MKKKIIGTPLADMVGGRELWKLEDDGSLVVVNDPMGARKGKPVEITQPSEADLQKWEVAKAEISRESENRVAGRFEVPELGKIVIKDKDFLWLLMKIRALAATICTVPDPIDGRFADSTRSLFRHVTAIIEEIEGDSSTADLVGFLREKIFSVITGAGFVFENMDKKQREAMVALREFLGDELDSRVEDGSIEVLASAAREDYATALAFVLATKGITQEAFAKTVGKSQPAVQYHISGRKKMRSDTAKKYAQALEVDVGDLID